MISKVGLERIGNLRIEILRMARYVQSIFNKTAVAVLERNEHQARDVIYSDSVIAVSYTHLTLPTKRIV